MVLKNRKGNTKDRYIDEAIQMIDEKGGSGSVNLRQISKRIGCAHTNAYNYFSSHEDLLWAAFEKTMGIYSDYILKGLPPKPSNYDYFDGLIRNMIQFSIEHPGLYRFINTDPLNMETMPEHILQIIKDLITYFTGIIHTLSNDRLTSEEAENVGVIILSYLDGETLEIINKRVLPGEDVQRRAIKNTHTLFKLLAIGNIRKGD